jgi:hypothetical protein
MFDFWYELPPLYRALFGLALIGVAVGTVFLTGYIYRWNIVVGAIGLVSLLFCGAGSNNNGYRF